MRTILGLDLSLTSTGIALIRNGDVELITRITSKGTNADDLATRRARLNAIGAQIMPMLGNHWGVTWMPTGADLVVIEAPSLGSRHGHAHDRSGLWWLVVNRIMAEGIPVAAVPPTCRAKYGTGKGNADKDRVLTDVVRRYSDLLPAPITVTKNDEADALLLAAMGSRHLGRPVEGSLPVEHLKAMAGVAWPPSP